MINRFKIMNKDGNWIYTSLFHNGMDTLNFDVNTLCQDTGKIDDYGNNIWEGDKLLVTGYYWIDKKGGEKGYINAEVVVVYQKKSATFAMKDQNNCVSFFEWDLIKIYDKKIRKIGNIYDRTDLLSD
jgi:hypothetical protein